MRTDHLRNLSAIGVFCRVATILTVIVVTRSLGAQARVPARPRLDAAADSNSWEAYYDRGVEWLNNREHARAEAAFYWSSRLNPRRAEPLFARWTVAWARDVQRFARYLGHDPEKPLPPELAQIDSLRYRALLRNPLVFQGLIMAAFQELPGRWREDAWTKAWLAYSTLDFKEALWWFDRALRSDSKRFGEVRYMRATIFVATSELDSAAAELSMLLDTLRRRDEEQLTRVYESKALVLYAVGLLQAGRRNYSAARAAFESSLVEDLSFYPPHIALAHLAVERREPDVALREFEQAAAGGANDVIARYEYGAALVRAGRPADGITELRAAVALEPYYADSYFWLGEALLTQNDSTAAREAFQRYAGHAPATAPSLGTARQRLAGLERKN
jgi:Tfp pilus assembly protein PilF